jgi:hypothetical protein
MAGTSPKCRQRGPKERGPYTPKPVQGRIITRHLTGQSNRRIAREEGIDRKTVDRILTQREVVEMIAQYRQRLLSLIPKAIDFYEDALSSDDERIGFAVAAKLLGAFHVMPWGDEPVGKVDDQASTPTEETRIRVLGKMTAMMFDKSDHYGTPLPPPLPQLRAAAEAEISAQGKPVIKESVSEALKRVSKK